MSTDINSLQRLTPMNPSGSNSNLSGVSVVNANKPPEKTKTEKVDAVEGQDLAAVRQAEVAKAQEDEQAEAAEASDVMDAVEFVNSQVQNYTRNLEFSVEEETGETIVRVYDTETEELVRQIPSEDMIEMARRLQEQHEASADSVEGLLFEVTA